MSNQEPDCPYVYQPDPFDLNNPEKPQRIFAVGGPGAEGFKELRMTRPEANRLLGLIEGSAPGTERAWLETQEYADGFQRLALCSPGRNVTLFLSRDVTLTEEQSVFWSTVLRIGNNTGAAVGSKGEA